MVIGVVVIVIATGMGSADVLVVIVAAIIIATSCLSHDVVIIVAKLPMKFRSAVTGLAWVFLLLDWPLSNI